MSNIDINRINEERGRINYTDLLEAKDRSVIKVVGVGGGGGNAVSKMYDGVDQIKGVTFLLCNTDAQALRGSSVPNKIVLGAETTKGLGAGNQPNVAQKAAEESREEIEKHLSSDDTEMVFVTAGMGGGTGTGAAPVVGEIAQSLGLLTVGIVTIPFKFEGLKKIYKALDGVNELYKHVDSLLIINNERLIDVCKNFTISNAFKHADSILSNAVGGISDLINNEGEINLDFADVKTTLKGGGIAVISSGTATGKTRMKDALDKALDSPLLNDNDITRATRLLIGVYTRQGEGELQTVEFEHLTNFTDNFQTKYDSKFGVYFDDTLEPNEIRVTVLASGFDFDTTVKSFGHPQTTTVEDRKHEAHEKELHRQAKHFYKNLESQKYTRPLLLTLSELDHDELIDILETKPALNRDIRVVTQIRQRYQTVEVAQPAARALEVEEEVLPQQEKQEDNNIILFGGNN